jgi:hypothetical protein
MRAESYRRRLFSEFDRAKEMFLPWAPVGELLNLAGAESESNTLSDEREGLVPAERQAE